jgi:AraC-like DNA-binding protein
MTNLMAKMTATLNRPTVGIPSLRMPRPLRDLEIVAAAHLPAKRQWIHRHFEMHAVGFVVSGRGEYRAGNGPVHAVHPGTQFSVFPGPLFDYGAAPGTTWEEYYVICKGRGLDRLLEAGWFPTDGEVHALMGIAPLAERFRELIRTVGRAGPGDADRGALMTERLLLEMYFSRATSRSARAPTAEIEAVLAHCHEHFAAPMDFLTLADRHGMSYSHLRQQMRKATGLPPHQYVIRLRCESAQKLLGETELPIYTVGDRVGIPDPYTFSRTFSRCVGMSPQRYRKTIARMGAG